MKDLRLQEINDRQREIDSLDKEKDLDYLSSLSFNRNNDINWYLEDFGSCLLLQDGTWVDPRGEKA